MTLAVGMRLSPDEILSLSLLLIGIHNAWDAVTHIVVTGSNGDAAKTE